MQTDQDATVITFPTRHTAAAATDVGAALVELTTDLRTAAERLHDLSIAVDRSLQFGNLDHIDDPIAFTTDLGDLIDGATRTLAIAGNQIQTATELWNRENNQQ